MDLIISQVVVALNWIVMVFDFANKYMFYREFANIDHCKWNKVSLKSIRDSSLYSFASVIITDESNAHIIIDDYHTSMALTQLIPFELYQKYTTILMHGFIRDLHDQIIENIPSDILKLLLCFYVTKVFE